MTVSKNSSIAKVSIIIVNWNSKANIIECLGSLRTINYLNYETIVVDNASCDGSPGEIRRLFPEVTLIKNRENLGWAGGNNIAMKYALNNGTQYIWFLNNDLVVESDALSKLVSYQEKLPQPGLVSPVIYFYSNRSKIQYCGSIFDRHNFTVKHFNDPLEIKKVDAKDIWLWYTALLIRREVVEKVGFFNEKYFVYDDDMEYSSRALKAGYLHRIDFASKVYHKSHFVDLGGDANLPLHFFYYTTRNDYLFWMKNTRGYKKLVFLRKYLSQTLQKIAIYKKQGRDDVADACLDGLYCGATGTYGQWDRNIKMPNITKKIILAHPYFWIDILEGNVRKITRGILRVIKSKFRKRNKDQKGHYVFLRELHKSCSWGGCEKQLFDIFVRTDYKRYKITLVTNKDIFSQRLKEQNIPIQVVNFPFSFNGNSGKRFFNLFNQLRFLKPDYVVYVQGQFFNFLLPDFFAGYAAARGNIAALEVLGAPKPLKKASRKHFKVIPGIGLWWWKIMLPIILRGWLCKKVVTVGKDVTERLTNWYYYPKKRVVTVHHGVDLEKFCPQPNTRRMMRQEFGIPEGDTIIISTSRLSKVKKVHRLINAFDLLCKDAQDCWLFLVGDGPLESQLKELANQEPSSQRIKFLGLQRDVAKFLQMGDIFVLPSDIEGLSNSMLEAMAVGLVCVITRAPGCSEVIKDGDNGFSVEPSQQGVTEGLSKALSLTKEQQRKISHIAYQFVKENFNVENGVHNTLKILGLNGNEKSDETF